MRRLLVVTVALFVSVAATTTVPKDDAAIVHVLNRIGFGPSPGDVEKVRAMGLERYLDQQLHPERVADAAMHARLLDAAAADRVLNGTGRDAFDAIKMLKTADPAKYQPAGGADYPRSPFGQALKQIAQLTKSNVGLEVAFADVGGWDTHVNQGAAQGQLANKLDDFSRAIAALVADLGDRLEDTVVLTMSEFGRAVNENGNRGTDHGHGNAMMVIGGGVRGGRVYGKWPGLDVARRYDGRDLSVTTDFRDVFGEIVIRHLGLKDSRQVFPGFALSEARYPGL